MVVTDHADEPGMKDVVTQGPDRIIPVNSQGRGDQIVGAQGEEVHPFRPGIDQRDNARPPRS